MINQTLMEDVLSGAFEGGSTYWVDSAVLVSSDEPRGDIMSDKYYTPKNFIWTLNTEDGPVKLYSNKLETAIKSHEGDFEDWDANDYDTILQKACFDNCVVYG